MCLLNGHLRRPAKHVECKHRQLLGALTQKVLERARHGLHTHIVKMKSHTGIRGNDYADELAKQAATPKGPGVHATVHVGSKAFEGIHWPYRVAACNSAQTMAANDLQEEEFALANLSHALKQEGRQRFQTGQANNTLYTDLWEAILPELDVQASNAFWTSKSVTATQVKHTLKVRSGQIWTMRRARIVRMPYFRGCSVPNHISCPLCGQADSTSHMLGECGDRDMKSIYIERHNEAARMILAEVLKGAGGNCIACADVGNADKTSHLGIDKTKIPATVIGDHTLRS